MPLPDPDPATFLARRDLGGEICKFFNSSISKNLS